jgi:lipoprotein-anchoring transpeptidase ErfK/SrfK
VSTSTGRRRRIFEVLVALVITAVVATVFLVLTNGPGDDTHVSVPPTSGPGAATSCTPSSAPAATTASSSAPRTTTTTVPEPNLAEGATGPDVVALQRRLRDLGFWLPEPTGTFDAPTTHAVVAFQKTLGLERDGVVGPLTRAALPGARRPVARSTTSDVVEIDLDRQIILVASNGRVSWVFDTSTGVVPGTTPIGEFRVDREIDALVHAPLGLLYRPKYFYEGVAIHGNPSVPPYPASHGCVRVINEAMDWLWEHDVLPIGARVLVY